MGGAGRRVEGAWVGRGAALGVLTLAACGRPVDPGAGGDGAAQVVVTPAAVRLDPGDSIDFTATAYTAAGEIADVTMTWAASAGSIAPRGVDRGRHFGRYQAGTSCGEQQVTVTARPGHRSNTAAVTVVCPAAVAAVVVTPATATIAVGELLWLAVVLQDGAGEPLVGRPVAWTTSDATVAAVSGDGRVVGIAADTATIRATSEGQSGGAHITVEVPIGGAPSGAQAAPGTRARDRSGEGRR